MPFSRALWALCLLALAATYPAAMAAQAAAYGSVGLNVYGVKLEDGNNYSFKKGVVGLTGGGFYDFDTDSRLKVGVDVRGSGSPGYDGGSFGAAALRFSFVPTRVRLRPFLEVGGGFVHSSANIYTGTAGAGFESSRSYNGGGLLLDFGLDIRLARALDLRLPEYGAIASSMAGTSFLNTGLVYHFR